MKNRIFQKISLLIIAITLFNIVFIIFGNILLDGNKFVFTEGTYTYDDLFFTQNEDKDYYMYSRGYFDEYEDKFILLKKAIENATFKAVPAIKASAILSFFPKEKIWGYCVPINDYLTVFPFDFSQEELMLMTEGSGFIIEGNFFDYFEKSYMLAVIKDEGYEFNEALTVEENYSKAVLSNNNHSIALFEIQGHDYSLLKPDAEQKIVYEKSFNNILVFPHSLMFWAVILIELIFLYKMISKIKRGLK